MVEHRVNSEVTGNFHEFSGEVILSNVDFTTAQIEVWVKVNSIDTNIDNRDSYLKSEDFFYVEKYPEMSFKSKRIEKTEKDAYQITEDLTIIGVTKPVIFDEKYGGSVTAFGNQRMEWKASTIINRFNYGLNWNKTIETGTLNISNQHNNHIYPVRLTWREKLHNGKEELSLLPLH